MLSTRVELESKGGEVISDRRTASWSHHSFIQYSGPGTVHGSGTKVHMTSIPAELMLTLGKLL